MDGSVCPICSGLEYGAQQHKRHPAAASIVAVRGCRRAMVHAFLERRLRSQQAFALINCRAGKAKGATENVQVNILFLWPAVGNLLTGIRNHRPREMPTKATVLRLNIRKTSKEYIPPDFPFLINSRLFPRDSYNCGEIRGSFSERLESTMCLRLGLFRKLSCSD